MVRVNSINSAERGSNFKVRNSKLTAMLIFITTLALSIFTTTLCQADLYALAEGSFITNYAGVRTNATGFVNIDPTAVMETYEIYPTGIEIAIYYNITDWQFDLATGEQYSGVSGGVKV